MDFSLATIWQHFKTGMVRYFTMPYVVVVLVRNGPTAAFAYWKRLMDW